MGVVMAKGVQASPGLKLEERDPAKPQLAMALADMKVLALEARVGDNQVLGEPQIVGFWGKSRLSPTLAT